jgi:hypothetical protein
MTIEQVLAESVDQDFEIVAASDSTLKGRPPLRGTSGQQRQTTTLRITHNLKPRALPLFGQLKSNMDISFEIGLEGETRANATGGEARTPITQQDKWRTQLSLTYSFSQNFRGQGLIRLENNHNRLTDKTRKIRELRLSGTFFLN